jgi:hypothetical protein
VRRAWPKAKKADLSQIPERNIRMALLPIGSSILATVSASRQFTVKLVDAVNLHQNPSS